MPCTPPRQRSAEWTAPSTLQAFYSLLRLDKLNMLPTSMLQRVTHEPLADSQSGFVTFSRLWNTLRAKMKHKSAYRVLKRWSSKNHYTGLLWQDPTHGFGLEDIARHECRGERVVVRVARGVREVKRDLFSVGIETHQASLVAFITGKSYMGMGKRALECLFPVAAYVEVQCSTFPRRRGGLRTEIAAVAFCTPRSAVTDIRCMLEAGPTIKSGSSSMSTLENNVQQSAEHDISTPGIENLLETEPTPRIKSSPNSTELNPYTFLTQDNPSTQQARDMLQRMRRQVEIFQCALLGPTIPGTTTPKLMTSRAKLDQACAFYRDALVRIKTSYELQAAGGVHPLCHLVAIDIIMRYLHLTVLVHDEGNADITVSHYLPLCAFSLALKYYGHGLNGYFSLAMHTPMDCDNAGSESCVSVGEGGALTVWLVRFYNQSPHTRRTPHDPVRMTTLGLTRREWLTFSVIDFRINLSPLDLVQELAMLDARVASSELFCKASSFLQSNLASVQVFGIDPGLLALCLTQTYACKTARGLASFVADWCAVEFSEDQIADCMRVIDSYA